MANVEKPPAANARAWLVCAAWIVSAWAWHGPSAVGGRQYDDRADQEQELPAPGPDRDPACHESTKLQLRTIDDISIDITPPEGLLPDDCSGELFGRVDPRDPSGIGVRPWLPSTFEWKATALCHRPLYFEDIALERHGHTLCPPLQPVLSAAHFFGTVPILPYKMGLQPPWECVYTLGHIRPGDPAPRLIYTLPLDLRAAAVQAGATVGAVFLVP
jgi:hypothetical protein